MHVRGVCAHEYRRGYVRVHLYVYTIVLVVQIESYVASYEQIEEGERARERDVQNRPRCPHIPCACTCRHMYASFRYTRVFTLRSSSALALNH